ncbi:MAG: hypothetical protein HY683_07715 [Chloroflexi bacterium]|nr:hypothetical protein [Chloroflexota bacterium]
MVLSASPSAGWEFQGWSGACIGTGNCTILMDSNKSVKATFIQPAVLVAYWQFNEGSGAASTDSAGAHQLSALNGAGFVGLGAGNSAAKLDGVDDRWQAADAPDLRGMSQLTIEAWVYPTGLTPGKNQGIVTKWGPGGPEDDSYLLVRTPDGRLWGAVQGSSRVDVSSPVDSLPLNKWSHVAMVYDGTRLQIYIDGRGVPAVAAALGPVSNGTFPVYVGRNDSDTQSPGTFYGYIDDMKLYSGARQISLPPTPPTPPPASQTIPVDTNPTGLAFDGTYVWVGFVSARVLKKVDPVTGEVRTATSDLGGMTGGNMLFDGSSLWVGVQNADRVVRINPSNGGVQCSTPVGSGPMVLAFDGTNVWVGETGLGAVDAIVKIGANCGVLQRFSTPDGPLNAAFDGQHLWVSYSDSNLVQRMDLSGNVLGTFTVAGTPQGVAVVKGIAGVDDSVWVASLVGRALTKIRLADGAVTTVPVDGSLSGIGFYGGNLWITIRDRNEVQKRDPSTGALRAVFPVGGDPQHLVFDGSNIWVANYTTRDLSKIPIDG